MPQSIKLLSVFNLAFLGLMLFLILSFNNAQQHQLNASASDIGGIGIFATGIGLFILAFLGLIPLLVGFYNITKIFGAHSLRTNEEKLLAIPLVLGGLFSLIVPYISWVLMPLLGIMGYREGTKAKIKL
jgi:uncharacterized membrane protein